ncbi:MAG TPA: MFS transporter [candidate division Zixibacteria bacterium]|nr:MFS transporter [candidate division Zixibacteria bacterium]
MTQQTDKPPDTVPPDRVRPWSSFAFRDYRLIWFAILCANTSMHMRNVTSLYHVYHISGSSLQLGLTGFFQAAPFVFFGLLGGVLADSVNRKKLILYTQIFNVVPGLALAALTATGSVQVWHVNLFNLFTAAFQVLGGPARQAIIPSLVPSSHLLNAVTLATLMMQSTQLVAPVLAGFLIDLAGIEVSYLMDAALLAPALVSVLMVRSSGQPTGERRRVSLRSLVEGFEFLWHTRIILSLFLLDFFAVLVGYYRPILPIFANDVFKVGAGGLGALYAAPAIGALVGSGLLLAVGEVERKGALSVIATLLFASSLGFLGLSRWFWLGLLAVGALGFSDAISVAVRRTVVQILAPDDMRGRASSFLTVFAQTTNALGAVIAGAAAAVLGAPNALLAGSVLCAASVLGVCWAIPQLWRYRSG